MLILLSLAGCLGVPRSCLTLPSEEGPFEGPLELAPAKPVRERQLILPGVSSTPPPPEAAVTSSQCDDLDNGGPVDGPGCFTDTISCGQTIIGHTVGGVRKFDTKFYEKKFCWPATVNHDGGEERVYQLVMPEGEWRAFVWMDSPCADLDLFAVRWNDDRCPSIDSNITHCESNLVSGVGDERVELAHQGQATWLLVVEGSKDEEGPFALHVQCREGIQ